MHPKKKLSLFRTQTKIMYLNPILFFFSFFVVRLFFFLAKKYGTNWFLYSLFGVLSFLISYTLFSSLSIILLSLAIDELSFSNEIVMSCFTIPFAILISGIYYKFLERYFKKLNEKSTINNIGK